MVNWFEAPNVGKKNVDLHDARRVLSAASASAKLVCFHRVYLLHLQIKAIKAGLKLDRCNKELAQMYAQSYSGEVANEVVKVSGHADVLQGKKKEIEMQSQVHVMQQWRCAVGWTKTSKMHSWNSFFQTISIWFGWGNSSILEIALAIKKLLSMHTDGNSKDPGIMPIAQRQLNFTLYCATLSTYIEVTDQGNWSSAVFSSARDCPSAAIRLLRWTEICRIHRWWPAFLGKNESLLPQRSVNELPLIIAANYVIRTLRDESGVVNRGHWRHFLLVRDMETMTRLFLIIYVTIMAQRAIIHPCWCWLNLGGKRRHAWANRIFTTNLCPERSSSSIAYIAYIAYGNSSLQILHH